MIGEHTGPQARVRDAGTLVVTATRPSVRLLNEAVYPTPVEQAAHSCTASSAGVRSPSGMPGWPGLPRESTWPCEG